MKAIINLIGVLLILLGSDFSNAPIVEWEYQHPVSGEGEALALIESKNGRIVYSGYQQKKGKKKDILLGFLGQNGNPVEESVLYGRTENEEANAIIETYDGGFLIGGYTVVKASENPHQLPLGKNAYLLKFNETGKLLWERFPGKKVEAEEIFDLLQLSDGTIIVVGQSKEQAYIAKLTEDGKTVLKEKLFGNYQTSIRAIANNLNGGLGITGVWGTSSKNKKQVFFSELNTELKELRSSTRFLGSLSPQIGEDLVYDFKKKNYYLAMGAIPRHARGGEDGVLEVKRSIQRFGKKEKHSFENHAKTILVLPSGKLFTAGYTNQTDLGIGQYNPILKEWEKASLPNALDHDFSRTGNDLFHNAYLQNDGAILLAGANQQESQKLRPWLVKIRTPSSKFPAYSKPQLSISNSTFRDLGTSESNDTLDGGERAYLSLRIKNQSTTPAYNLKAAVSVQGLNGIDYYQTVNLGALEAVCEKTYGIPLLGKRTLATGTVLVSVRILDEQRKEVLKLEKTIPTKAAPLPNLEITHGTFLLKDTSITDREETIHLKVVIKNTGKATARNVMIDFSCPYLVNPLQGEHFPLDTLSKGDSISLIFPFLVNYFYQSNQVLIRCKVYEDSVQFSRNYAQFNLPIRDYLDIELPQNPFVLPKDIKQWHIDSQGPDPGELNIQFRKETPIRWLFSVDATVQDSIYRRVIIEQKGIKKVYFPELILVARIEMDSLKKSEVQFYQNDELLTSNNPDDTTAVRFLSEEKGDAYRYFRKVRLKVGQNYFHIQIGKKKSRRFKVIYSPPELFIYLIGINHKDLYYADKDAIAMLEAYKTQENSSLYQKIHTHIIDSAHKATDKNLYDFFRQNLFKKRYKDRYQQAEKDIIDPQDKVLIYISDHGDTSQYSYEIQTVPDQSPGMTESKSGDIYSFPFEKQVFVELDSFLNCQKVILMLDACFSGYLVDKAKVKPSNNYSKTIDSIIIADPNSLYVIASSLRAERSFELPQDSIGAFTKAVLEAFACRSYTNPQNQIEKACGTDGILTMNELSKYLKFRVPELVAQDPLVSKNEHSEKELRISQNPILSREDHTPLFDTRLFKPNR